MNPTRLRILLAGLKLFGAQGYHGTAIRDIAAAGGMQSASLYSHFASKEAILAELVFIGHDAHHQILLRALLESGADPREQLRALITAHVAAHCRWADLAVVSNYERQHLSPELGAPSTALRERSVQLLVEILARGKAQGVFDIVDDVTTRGALGALGLSALMWYPNAMGEVAPEDVGASCAQLALRMVGA
jgi:AcrR family transcriptional regulator